MSFNELMMDDRHESYSNTVKKNLMAPLFDFLGGKFTFAALYQH